MQRGRFSCFGVMVTAADRAAATYAALRTNPSARLRRAPPLSGEALHGDAHDRGYARKLVFPSPAFETHTPLPPSAEGGDHPRQRMVEDIRSHRNSTLPSKRLILSQPIGKAVYSISD